MFSYNPIAEPLTFLVSNAGGFVLHRKNIMADKSKIKNIPIKCPVCKAIAFHWNGVTKMPLVAPCKECGRRIAFYPETNEVKVSREPIERTSSSGKRFN